MKTVNLVRNSNWSIRKAARYVGVHPSTVLEWLRKARMTNSWFIPTLSSRPHSHPRMLRSDIVAKIVELRNERRRCAEVIHHDMLKLGYSVSLSSVKRVLRRKGLIRPRGIYKRWHFTIPRPSVVKPGDLVQVDTIHVSHEGLYVYTLLDIFSRWAYASASVKINTRKSTFFVYRARERFRRPFRMLQSDHGAEFSTSFSERVRRKLSCEHRHSRIRKPTDNGHLERFNRTLQEECLNGIPQTFAAYQKAIPEYLHYYNTERTHLGLNMRTPEEVLRSY